MMCKNIIHVPDVFKLIIACDKYLKVVMLDITDLRTL